MPDRMLHGLEAKKLSMQMRKSLDEAEVNVDQVQFSFNMSRVRKIMVTRMGMPLTDAQMRLRSTLTSCSLVSPCQG